MRLGRIQKDYSANGFDLVKGQGLDFIEICCNNEDESDRLVANAQAVKDQIGRAGLPVSCVGRWNHDIVENGMINEAKREKYKALLETAIFLGAKTFVCGCNYDDTITLYKNYTNAIDLFSSLLSFAREKNSDIHIAIQNCDWNNFVVSPREWEVILGELPELYIKYDASHAYNRGEDYLGQLSDWGKRVAHIHIKGTTHAGKNAVDDPPAGMDDIAWGSLFSILYARGYDGDLSIEPHSRTWRGNLGAKGVEFTKNYIGKFILN